jgi:hypothetical protein
MRSTLIQTGVMRDVDTAPALVIHPEDENIYHMLSVITGFFKSATSDNGSSISDLYEALTKPGVQGIGLKRGVTRFISPLYYMKSKEFVIFIQRAGNEVERRSD